ncbi:hypothetical protein [Cryocola sp. 340MFSha3.1]|uniref:hypothetical protein n=1 Tax=Cryocola sp. 340MFSha3.1 TaxID=1169145 RepID=UPI0003638134|nr:hypothetical protein [Cryocola sp. 340MFSha3.1]
MTTATPARKRSALYIAMTVLIVVVIASIVVQIVLGLTGHAELARVVNPFTFAMLSGFFLVFGVYSGRKGKPTQSVGGYIAAGCWILYTALLIAGVM